MQEDIYSWIRSEESRYDTEEVRVGDNWNWNMSDHVQLIFHLKNSKFFKGENDYLRAFKNIMEPVLNLAYWMEDIEVKDIVFFIENKAGRALSFLIKKYHDEVFVKENNVDTLLDEITESDVDFGGVLVQPTQSVPEVVPLQTIAFCDQTNILGGPIGFKHNFSPSGLRKMKKAGWGEPANGATISLDELIILAEAKKDPEGMQGQKKNNVTGKNIEVYIVKGDMPEHWLLDNDNMHDYYGQVQIRAFCTDKNNKKHGVALYRKKEQDLSLRFHTSQKVHGRGVGRGGGEGLIHPQIWTNFGEIHKMRLLEAGSKVVLQTDDQNYTNRNAVQDMENLEVTTTEEGKQIRQVPTVGVNQIQLFSNSIENWFQHAQLIGSAFDPVLGKEASSGTTFRGQERTVSQGRGLHERRRGQRAKFIERIYRDFIIPKMVKEILGGKEFLATLTSEELTWVSDQLAENHTNREILEAIVAGREPGDKEALKQEFLESFSRGGNKKILKILKDEFRGINVRMGINIAGKQKELAAISDKLLSVFQFILSNPQAFQVAMQNPSLAKAFNDIMEFSGLNPSDFSMLATLPAPRGNQPSEQTEITLNREPVAA